MGNIASKPIKDMIPEELAVFRNSFDPDEQGTVGREGVDEDED